MMATALAPIPARTAPARQLTARAARWARPALLAGVMLALAAPLPAPAFAQDTADEARLRKLEAEVRALQRKVFPGGDPRFFEPQIQPGGSAASTATTAPSTTAVTDILQRLDAIELQLQRLTALGEENSNAIAQLSTRMAAIEGGTPALAAGAAAAAPSGEAGAAPATAASDTTAAAADTDTADDADAAEEPRAMASNLAAMGASSSAPSSTSAPATSGAQAGPSPDRLAAVQAITKPATDDPGDDEYSYGFRLWDAGFYPEARQQLAAFVEGYPDHWRATYGRNLLGRAYLDDGKAEDAARWFLKNYQEDRMGARAPDSLLYLAQSMIALGDTRRACIALAEFGETYPAAATGRLADKYARHRGEVRCGA